MTPLRTDRVALPFFPPPFNFFLLLLSESVSVNLLVHRVCLLSVNLFSSLFRVKCHKSDQQGPCYTCTYHITISVFPYRAL